MDQIKIEKGIPIPLSRTKRCSYPFENMSVGDSFLVPFDEKREPKALSSGIRQSAIHFIAKQENRSKKFSVYKTEQGVRCWRVK